MLMLALAVKAFAPVGLGPWCVGLSMDSNTGGCRICRRTSDGPSFIKPTWCERLGRRRSEVMVYCGRTVHLRGALFLVGTEESEMRGGGTHSQKATPLTGTSQNDCVSV